VGVELFGFKLETCG